MSLKLSSLVSSHPDAQWFHYADTPEGPELLDEADKATAAFSLQVSYLSDRERKQFWEQLAQRVPKTKKGLKNILASEDDVRIAQAKAALVDWKLTAAGAYALRAKLDLAGVDPKTPIPFDEDSIDTMLKHSSLSYEIQTLLNSHEHWYTAPGSSHDEEESGNSSGGPSGSSDGLPAKAASTDTGKPTKLPTTSTSPSQASGSTGS